ncbi:MAG: hypothetical protein ACI4XF_12365 [Oscillospiraceae bacterium]
MYIRKREESIEQLSEMLNKEKLRKLIMQGYSDISLSVMADFKNQYASDMADSKFFPLTVNKLTEAYANDRISIDDLFRVMEYSKFTVKNEPYVDSFLNSIDNGVYHETAAKIFAAVNYENCTYSEALGFVKSGAFYPTEYASLSVTDKVAEQLSGMGVKLRGCEGYKEPLIKSFHDTLINGFSSVGNDGFAFNQRFLNNCYDIAYLKEAIDNGDAVFVQDKSLAVQVHEMMKLPDWEKFRDEVRYVMENDMDKLTGDKLAELRTDYIKEKYSAVLFKKVKGEYDSFMEEMRSGSVENAIQNAYGIVAKGKITMYCEEYTPDLIQRPYNVSKLMLFIIEHSPKEKRLVYAQNMSKDPDVWKDSDEIRDYHKQIKNSFEETFRSSISKGVETGAEIGEALFGTPGRIIGGAIGGLVGAVGGFFSGFLGGWF